MSESDQPGFLQQAGNFAADATVDTAADGFINNAIDGVASHLPGGSAVDRELGNLEGMFGHHEEAPAADPQS